MCMNRTLLEGIRFINRLSAKKFWNKKMSLYGMSMYLMKI
jgi:hypothetical protein